jgi:cell division protein FtsQ
MWLGSVDTVNSVSVQVSEELLDSLPSIRDVPRTVIPELGSLATEGGILNALAILGGLSAEMRGQVSSISAPDAVKTVLTLKNNVTVAFGAAEDIEAKEIAVKTLLAEHQGTITSINVRVPDRATYRAAE